MALIRFSRPFFLAALALSAALCAAAATPQPPELRIEGPASHAALIEQLRGFDRDSVLSIMELLGLEKPGPPIRVVVASEGSIAARRAPSWSVAYAVGEAGLIVVLPSRIPAKGFSGYPDNSLEAVLRHEIAHVLIARAARRRPVPRWFNEGLAIFAAHGWGISDRTHLMWATLRRGPSLSDLDQSFQAGSYRAGRAYALAAAFTRFLLERHGGDAAARVLERVGEGRSFTDAFRLATGSSLAQAEDRFWRQLDFWNKWIPYLTSSAMMWIAITALALWAFKRRRDRDADLRAAWEEEERFEQASSNTWIH